MIGIVICCHGKMGEGMRDAAEMIIGPQEQLGVISVQPGDGGNDVLEGLTKAIKEVDSGDGVLMVTDLFGGTPTNIGCALLGEASIEVVTGFNLPLLIKALTSRRDVVSLSELARTASEYGQRHISVAGDLLQGGGGE
ncbi:MAG: PTS sugar transporter subunit IIA [Proteobacteria bacterium]|nr:PTS sugar transporter subunit IIA [Pseudomonadota bacterium]